MGVQIETIINRMKKELQEINIDSMDEVKRRMERIRVLCDIILEESFAGKEKTPQSSTSLTPEEMRTMIGEPKKMSTSTDGTRQSNLLQEGDANGDSIFDF